MNRQMTIDDLIVMEEPKVTIPEAAAGEKVYRIPDDVWEGRCQLCVHKHAQENVPIPQWAVHKYSYDKIIPCRIMGLSLFDRMPGECLNFAPRMEVEGICNSCRHDSYFHEGFCMKEGHAEQRRVYWGKDYGGDKRKIDYYARHRLSVCDDYEPNEFVNHAVR